MSIATQEEELALQKADQQQRAYLDSLLKEVGKEFEGETPSLVQVLGEHRPVEGKPGWFVRPIKLRQQIQIAQAFGDFNAEDRNAATLLEDMARLATFLLYLRDPEPGFGRFRPATEDEILDTFDSDELNALVLAPMGFGILRASESESEGNAGGATGDGS